jgi:cardiolipin synthase
VRHPGEHITTSTAVSARLLADRAAEWSARLRMVEDAREFLVLTTYYFGSDSHSATMLEALTRAQRRGVRVTLAMDRFGQRLAGNLGRPPDHHRLRADLDTLREAGGHVFEYTPRTWRHRLVGGGMHVKIQVSEAGAAIFGSSNVAHHSFRRWNEVSMHLEGPIVGLLLDDACRCSGLDAHATRWHRERLATPHPHTGQGIRLGYLCEDPERHSAPLFPFGDADNRLTAEMVAMIERARRTLRITAFYCKPALVLRDALLRACRRGVDVEIFHSHRDSLEVSQAPWMSASNHYAALLEAGASIYENHDGEHSKVVLVDDEEVAVGSYNFEHAAHDRLVEAMLFCRDPDLCAQFSTFFDALRASPANLRVGDDWLRRLPRLLRVKRWLHHPMERWI